MDKLQVEYLSPDELVLFDGNPRQISEAGLKKLEESLHTFGFTNPILVQKNTRIVIAGNQRLKAAREIGLKEIPVIMLDFEDEMAKAYNIADNRLHEESTWENDSLAVLLRDLEDVDFDLLLTGFDNNELRRLIGEVPEVPKEEENREVPEEPVSKTGELW